jgi:hypothetical protein
LSLLGPMDFGTSPFSCFWLVLLSCLLLNQLYNNTLNRRSTF